jgi:FAD/FMN-containing dehydrogenase
MKKIDRRGLLFSQFKIISAGILAKIISGAEAAAQITLTYPGDRPTQPPRPPPANKPPSVIAAPPAASAPPPAVNIPPAVQQQPLPKTAPPTQTASGPAQNITRSQIEELNRELGGAGQVLTPGSQGYARVPFYNGRFDCIKPSSIVQPKTEEELQKILKWTRAANGGNGVKFAIKGGGHSYEALSKINGLVIDMSRLKKLGGGASQLNSDGSIDVGAGDILKDVYSATLPKNRFVPAGTCETVGAVGHALGGGFGDMSSQLGYVGQSIKQVRMVTFDGKLIEANDTSIVEIIGGQKAPYSGRLKPDELMKSLRGGGQALAGAVTSIKLDTHDVSQKKMHYYKHEGQNGLSLDQAQKVISAWQQWRNNNRKYDKAISTKMELSRSGNTFSISISGVVSADQAADVAQIKSSMAEFLSPLGAVKSEFPAQSQNAQAIYNKYKDTAEFSENKKRNNHMVRSNVVPNSIPPDGIKSLLQNLPGSVGVAIYGLGGKANENLERTSLPKANFMIEMETVKDQGEFGKSDYDSLDRYHKSFTSAAGFTGAKNVAYSNYPGDIGQSVTSNPEGLRSIRNESDPNKLAYNPIVDKTQGRASTQACVEGGNSGGQGSSGQRPVQR